MHSKKLSELDVLDVGNEIQLAGAVYAGKGETFLIPLPDEDPAQLFKWEDMRIMAMSDEEMARFLNQTDVLDVQSKTSKAILRKSQRQVDQVISWRVFRRDGYSCRYCGRDDVPLTVDHVDLWEDGGATIEANLLSACRRCNKTRGNVDYRDWITSPKYAAVSSLLTLEQKQANLAVLIELPRLVAMRVKRRSR